MRLRFPAAFRDDLGMRMMFRSAHLYILLAALLNLVAGAHLRARVAKWLQRVQVVGSGCLLVSPVMFTAAFFAEPAPQRLDRPIVLLAAALALLGAILHTIASYEKADTPGVERPA
ncbi:MAG: hypothetical protein HY000_34215 [Planctomycetes bacterium]|nr:hypothetical protein [Planctomycetota bacterium]